jgi:hypothetical protein
MPFTSSKVKALGVIFLNKSGLKYYSKYYTKHTTSDFLSAGDEYNIRS